MREPLHLYQWANPFDINISFSLCPLIYLSPQHLATSLTDLKTNSHFKIYICLPPLSQNLYMSALSQNL